jgi:hypothetical protein
MAIPGPPDLWLQRRKLHDKPITVFARRGKTEADEEIQISPQRTQRTQRRGKKRNGTNKENTTHLQPFME